MEFRTWEQHGCWAVSSLGFLTTSHTSREGHCKSLQTGTSTDQRLPHAKQKQKHTDKQNLVHPNQRLRKKVAKDRKSFGQYPPTIFFSPLHFFLRLSKSFSCICVVYFWLLYFVSLINMSIPLPKPLSVSYCGCRVVLNVG